MKKAKRTISIGLGLAVILAATAAFSQDRRTPGKTRAERFRHSGKVAAEGPAGFHGATRGNGQEAPTGYDNLTNGFMRQGPRFDTIDQDNVMPLRSFNDARFTFEQTEDQEEGLGPRTLARVSKKWAPLTSVEELR